MKKATRRWCAGVLTVLALAMTMIQPAQAEQAQQKQAQQQELTKKDAMMPALSTAVSPKAALKGEDKGDESNTLIPQDPIPPMIPDDMFLEPNDDISHASSVTANMLYFSTLGEYDDVDVYKFTATKSTRYHLSVKTPALNTFSVKVMNKNGITIATGQSKQGIQQEVEFFGHSNNVFYFEITDVNGDMTEQNYLFKFTESSGVYVYDSQNRILNYTVHRGLNNYRMDYTYDSNGVLLKKTKVAL